MDVGLCMGNNHIVATIKVCIKDPYALAPSVRNIPAVAHQVAHMPVNPDSQHLLVAREPHDST